MSWIDENSWMRKSMFLWIFTRYEINFLSFPYKVLTLDYIWNSYLRSIMLLSGIYFPCLSFDVFNLQHFKNWSYFPQVVDNYVTQSSFPLDLYYLTFKCVKNVGIILCTREYVRSNVCKSVKMKGLLHTIPVNQNFQLRDKVRTGIRDNNTISKLSRQ